MILPASQKPLSLSNNNGNDSSSLNVSSPASSNSSNNLSEQPPLRPLGKLEDMKGNLTTKRINEIRPNKILIYSRLSYVTSLYVFSEWSQSGIETSESSCVGLETSINRTAKTVHGIVQQQSIKFKWAPCDSNGTHFDGYSRPNDYRWIQFASQKSSFDG